MYKFLTASVLTLGLLLQACSKKDSVEQGGNPIDQGPVETATKKLIPDSVFRAYLKAKICPTAFDASGKYIDITNSEVANFTGTMTIDTVTCPRPFVASLKGVEYFQKMTKLIVKNSLLDSLNLTQTMALDTIKIVSNKDLQYLAVSGCTSLRFIRVGDMPATSLNFSNLPQLNYINLVDLGRLNDLKLDNAPNLQHLMTYGLSSIKTVNVSTNANLRRLYLEYCYAITNIDVTHNPKLKHLAATYCTALKTVDLSKNDSLATVWFDDSGIDTLDFSHNRELYSVTMFRTAIRNLSLLNNPKVCQLSLDGSVYLKNVDLRAQKKFDYWFVPASVYVGISEDDRNQIFLESLASPVQTAQHTSLSQPARAGVNGATTNLFGGLRVPQYLDANGLSLVEVKVNKAVKDNYSLVMARRVLGNMTPALITVYDDDMTTVLCHDYSPEQYKCN